MSYYKEAVKSWTDCFKRKLILEALIRNDWNRKKSAKELGLSYRAILYEIKWLQIVPGQSLETVIHKPGSIALESHSPALETDSLSGT